MENTRKILFTVIVHYLVRGKSISLIHPHVQRNVLTVCEATICLIELVGGNSKIQQDSVYPGNSDFGKTRNHIAIIAADNGYLVPKRFQTFTRSSYRGFILIYAY